jgi:fatty acid desaturase
MTSETRSGLLRYKADRRTLVFVAAYGVLASAGWFHAPKHPALLALLIAVTSLSSWIVAVITHNTIHCPVFHSRTLNKLFQIWLSLSYGFPVSEFVPGHNLSHHRHTQKAKDLMRTSKVTFRWNLLNLLVFVPKVGVPIARFNYVFAARMKQSSPGWYRQLMIETTLVWGTKLALLAIDWKKALFFVLIPHLFAAWGIIAINLAQHDGCDEDHPYNHSRNFIGRVLNWFTFNNGFHGMHHHQPGMHWSLLRQAHMREIHPHIHPALEPQSLVWYILRTYVWPAPRRMYTGEPVSYVQIPDEELPLESEPVSEIEREASPAM